MKHTTKQEKENTQRFIQPMHIAEILLPGGIPIKSTYLPNIEKIAEWFKANGYEWADVTHGDQYHFVRAKG